MDYEFDRALLKRTLKKKKITYARLVELLQQRGINLTENAVKFWFGSMKGKPTLDKAKVIADILDIPFNELAKQSVFTTSNTQTTYGGNNTNIQGNNNTINIENDELDELPNKEKFTTPKFREFLQLYSCYGNEKMLDPIIDKIKKAKEILEN